MYLQRGHNLTNTSDGIRASLHSQKMVTERVHARRVINLVIKGSSLVQDKSIFFVEEYLEKIIKSKIQLSYMDYSPISYSSAFSVVALSTKLIRSWVTQQNLGLK